MKLPKTRVKVTVKTIRSDGVSKTITKYNPQYRSFFVWENIYHNVLEDTHYDTIQEAKIVIDEYLHKLKNPTTVDVIYDYIDYP